MFNLKTVKLFLSEYSWFLGSLLIITTILLIIRWATDILNLDLQYDEKYIIPPILNLINDGWTVENLLDYKESKGPSLFIIYSLLSEVFGNKLNDLRLISLFLSIFCMLPLLLIGKLCGAKDKDYLLICICWLLMPYLVIFSQLVMGEISYLFIAILSIYFFLWGINNQDSWKGYVLSPIALFILCSIGLHNRLHLVALLGGICIVAIFKQGKSSWPWILACLMALLSRLPLWIYWGGPVNEELQVMHSFGFRIEGMAYLLAALSVTLTIFLLSSWRIPSVRKWTISAGLLGLVIMFFSEINLNSPPNVEWEAPNQFFSGVIATFTKTITDNEILQKTFLMIFTFLGLSGLLGLFFEAKYTHKKNEKLILELTFYTLSLGCFLFLFTEGFAFDRYLISWGFLLPLVWWIVLPNRFLIAQCVLMLLLNANLIWVYLL